MYQILFKYGPLTAHEVVNIARTVYPLANQTSFNARLSELKKIGVALEVGEKINPISNQNNYLWDVNSNLPEKLETKKKQKCPHCGK